MPSLTERVKAAEATAQQRAWDDATRRARETEQENSAAHQCLTTLLAEELGIDQFDFSGHMQRLHHPRHGSGDDSEDLWAFNVEGYWLGIRVNKGTHDDNMAYYQRGGARLHLLVVCPNRHVTNRFYRPANPGEWEYHLARIGAEMAAVAADGGCYQCITDGKQTSLHEQVLHLVGLGHRDATLALVRSLLSDYQSEATLHKALAAADAVLQTLGN